MWSRLSTRDISLDEFEKVDREVNHEHGYKNAASELLRVGLRNHVAKRFAIEKLEAQGEKYTKIEIASIINDPSLKTFDSSEPIAVNFRYSQILEG